MVSLSGMDVDKGRKFFRVDCCTVGANLVFALVGAEIRVGRPTTDNGTAAKGGRPGGSALREGICDTILTFTTVGQSACGGRPGLFRQIKPRWVGPKGVGANLVFARFCRNDAPICHDFYLRDDFGM